MHLSVSAKTAARLSVCLCVSLLLAAIMISALPTDGEEKLYDRVIRLHVLANSDGDDDQALKLQVRDAILTKLSALSASCDNVCVAEAIYTACLPELQRTAEETVTAAGYDYDCRVTLTRECYPVRTYDTGDGCYTLPAGTYRSLRVMIGEAAGQNWWCVLFPPLCLSLAAEEKPFMADAIPVSAEASATLSEADTLLLAAGFTPYEISLISGEGSPKTVVKFRIVEWIRSLLAK